MNTRIMRFVVATAFSLAALSTVYAEPGNGVPFQQLQLQIDGLQAQVQALAEQINQGGDQNVTVNCGAETIGAALANASPGGRLTITVNGNCMEDVTIERDRVTLKDGTVSGTGAMQPVIQIIGARGIVIDNMTVQNGATHGVFANNNADVTITNSTVQNNAQDGVQLRWGAFGDIRSSTISGNAECAVSPRDGANVLLTNNPLVTTAQPDAGICSTIGAYRTTTVRLAGGNTITNTGGGAAMDIIQGSAVRAQSGVDTIMGQVFISRLANVDLRNANITGNISVTNGAWLRVRTPSSVTGNIFIDSMSLAQFQGVPSINGPVICGSSQSVGIGTDPNFFLNLVVPPGPPPAPPFPVNVVTSQGEIAPAFRGIAQGNIAGGGFFIACN